MNLTKMTAALCTVVMSAGFVVFTPEAGLTAEAAESAKKSIATINITTDDEYKEKPPGDLFKPTDIENAYGCTLINNKFINCTFEYIDPNGEIETIVDDSAMIKLRGNSSAVARKLPYKLKFEKKRGFSTDAKSKKWVLLNSGTDLHFLFSNFASGYLGSEWQPAFEYVNLTYNGDYKGTYILVEAVEQMMKDLDIEDQGFMAENGAYWWAEKEGDYFKIDGIDPHVGFYYKEPEPDDLEPEQKEAIKNKIEDAAAKIMSDSDTDYLSAIDVESAASWFLTKDYICNSDVAGSNMYWYASTMDSPLKLGPQWDFDRDYNEYYADKWSPIHKSDFNFGSYLFEKNSFKKAYRDKFEETLDMRTALPEYVNEYCETYGDSIQESWLRDAERWGKISYKVDKRKNLYLTWYGKRQKMIDYLTADWNYIGINETTIGFSSESAGEDSDSFYYTGSAVTPVPQITYGTDLLTSGTDYEVSYSENVDVGTATMTVTGIGKYTGIVSKTFNIVPKPITGATVTLSEDSFVCDGNEKRPGVTVMDDSITLVLDTDYTIAYSNNINAGTATMTVTGIGKYTGIVSKTFNIVPKTITGATVTLSEDSFVCDGNEKRPGVTVMDDSITLVLDTDYTIAYSNNINAGTATVTVTGKGNYTGELTAEFVIKQGFLYGDLNDDGEINIDDLLLMQKLVAGWRVKANINMKAADVVPDGTIDADDLVLMQKRIAGWKVKLG